MPSHGGLGTQVGGPSNNTGAIQYLTGVSSDSVLESDWDGSTYRPGYLLLLDHEAKSVVLSVRGTEESLFVLSFF